jgi:hypothetical protein
MGGRGATSGISVKGYEYGTEFKSLLRVDNIKFVQYQLEKNAKIPEETMYSGRNRVYVIVSQQNVLKFITFYNKEGKLRRQIDLDHEHNKRSPHVHAVKISADLREIVPLSKSDKAYIEKVRKIWVNQFENRIWLDDFSKDSLEDYISALQPFCFQYNGRDYLIEAFGARRNSSLRFIIVDPVPYYEDGGWPEKYDFAYPGHLEAKTPEEFKALPFIDGKTIIECFDELRFFDS